MNFTEEMIQKAKSAQSSDALLAMAKENGIAMTQEEAAGFYARLHDNRALSDEELENVSGGCGSKPVLGRVITNLGDICPSWICKHDGWKEWRMGETVRYCPKCMTEAKCQSCVLCRQNFDVYCCRRDV